MEALLIAALVLALTAFVTTLINALTERGLSFFFGWLNFQLRRKILWKTLVPKEYANRRVRDVMLRLKRGKAIEILSEEYEVKGLGMYNFGGEKIFEFRVVNKDGEARWVEFDHENIRLWGEWDDWKMWGDVKPRGEKIPDPMPIEIVRRGLPYPPIFKIAGVEARCISICFSRTTVGTVWGSWDERYAAYREVGYKGVIAKVLSIKGKRPISRPKTKDLYIGLEATGAEELFNEFYVGLRLEEEDIELKPV